MVAEARLIFCVIGVSQGSHTLYFPRGVTVHFDCRIHAGLCEYLEDQAQTHCKQHHQTERRVTRNSELSMSIQGLHLHGHDSHSPHSLANDRYPDVSLLSLALLLNKPEIYVGADLILQLPTLCSKSC